VRIVSVEQERATLELSMEELGLIMNALSQELGHQEARLSPINSDLRAGYQALQRDCLGVTGLMDSNETHDTTPFDGDMDTSSADRVAEVVPPENLDAFIAQYFEDSQAQRNGSRTQRLALQKRAGHRPSDWFTDALVIHPEFAEIAWPIVLKLVALAPDPEALSDVAAGPLEDLVQNHARQFSDRLLERARSDSRFRDALRSVWGLERMSEPLRGQLFALLDPDR
jgi:hypothetical protein